MSKCPFGKEEEINTYLEGYNPFKGEWKTINNEIIYKKDCENVLILRLVKNGNIISNL